MKKLIIALFVMVLGIGLLGMAYAATVNMTMDVTANSVASCTATVAPLNFGDYVGNTTFANGDVTVNCTSGVNYIISLDAGSNYDIWATYRSVCGASTPADCTPYTLYQDAPYGIAWGDLGTTHPADIVRDTADGLDQPHTVYGVLINRFPAPAPGLLTDVVNVSVFY
jgi:spore coat protein U-like protein